MTGFAPDVSVLMGMYNCARTLPATLRSLAGQTHAGWELVACDDGSTDETWDVAREAADRFPGRVVLLRNEVNQGLTYSLNRCLQAARGEFLARQDADDESLPERFERQVAFLRRRPEYGWVSCAMVVSDGSQDVGVRCGVAEPTMRDLIRSSCFAHAPTMFRATVLRSVDGYRVAPHLRRGQDYDLWMRLFARGFRGYNLPDALYRVREDSGAYARKDFRNRINEAITRFHGYRTMGASPWAYLFVLRPLVVGSLPTPLLRRLHRSSLRSLP